MPEAESKNNSKAATLVIPIVVALIVCLGTIVSAVIAKVPVPTLSIFTPTSILIIITETPSTSSANPASTNMPTPTSFVTSTSVQTPTILHVEPTFTSALENTLTEEQYLCPFSTNNDQATLLNIVEVESRAAVNKDFETLKLIYFPNATVTGNGKTWQDPIQELKDFFVNYDLLEVNNSDIRIQFIGTKNAIVYRTASSYILNKKTNKITKSIDDSGYITFGKDANDCWRISRFDKAPKGYKSS